MTITSAFFIAIIDLSAGFEVFEPVAGILIGEPHFLHFAVRPAASSGAFSFDLQFVHSNGIM